ncbi:MAG: hypothetical protein PHH00_03885 [Candidatus Nanoarchaeia archaeon]|nr:hypothetical protein [Candidatus Nanoarchaeia archaeon]
MAIELECLKNDEFGRGVVELADKLLPHRWKIIKTHYKRNDNSHPHNDQLKEGDVFGYSTLFSIAALNTALDKLGVRKIRTANPDDVLEMIRLNHPLMKNSYPLGIVITEKPEGGEQRVLVEQAGVKNFPVLLSGLRLARDDRYPEGVRFVFGKESSSFYAPGFGYAFHTTPYQKFKALAENGKRNHGEMPVASLDSPSERGFQEAYYFDKGIEFTGGLFLVHGINHIFLLAREH